MLTNIKTGFLSREVYEIYAACMFHPSFERFAEKAKDFARNPDIQCLGWHEEGGLVGVTVLQSSSGEILGIAVREDFRGRGIGRRMIEALPSPVLCAETDDDAVGFYGSCGFSIEPFTEYYDGQPCQRYRCTLRR